MEKPPRKDTQEEATGLPNLDEVKCRLAHAHAIATKSRIWGRFECRDESGGRPDPKSRGTEQRECLPWSPHLRSLLCGTKDPGSPLRFLRGHESTMLRKIYEMLVETWRDQIKLTPPANSVMRIKAFTGFHLGTDNDDDDDDAEGELDTVKKSELMSDCRYMLPEDAPTVRVANFLVDNTASPVKKVGHRVKDRPEIAFAHCGAVSFPPPMDRDVNMLPFVMGDIESLPDDLKPYYDTLIASCPVKEDELGKVCYLTVSEGLIRPGTTQRRPGLHIEAPGSMSGPGGSFVAAWEHHWGRGSAYTADEFNGGLYMASNLGRTCRVWDALVSKGEGLVDHHGGCEHLRPFLGKGTKLRANQLVWLTDRTPHEAVPLTRARYRQFFRLVTSHVSVWFAAHSTPNPKVPLPDFVKVIEDRKFQSVQANEGATSTR